MVNDACNIVKTDLQAGSYTYYTTSFPIYIRDQDKMEGGKTRIEIYGGIRIPIMSAEGSVIFYDRSCTIEIQTTSTTIRDNLYTDVLNILKAASNTYTITDIRDYPDTKNIFRVQIDVDILI